MCNFFEAADLRFTSTLTQTNQPRPSPASMDFPWAHADAYRPIVIDVAHGRTASEPFFTGPRVAGVGQDAEHPDALNILDDAKPHVMMLEHSQRFMPHARPHR
ncbi:hypothetical protein GCM10022240_30300 [Microbacterium kribbense]|uniref:Uncharacterized protein n=1 Tax=Microbacterium kribbense TaxID=433645 RepID=A0ABP7H0I8_9MICO